MEFICKKEAIRENGEKLMAFTKGKIYEFNQDSYSDWIGLDDNKTKEEFFNLDIMFDPI